MQNPPSAASQPVQWYHPGEVVIVARVRRGALNERTMHAALRGRVGDQIPTDPASLRSFVFDAEGQPSLVFFVQKLSDRDSARTVRDVVERLHGELGALGTDDIEVLGAMPHVHLKAHDGFFGGSPGSEPVPVKLSDVGAGGRYREYLPASASLKSDGTGAGVQVAVLDTHWPLDAVQQKAERFRASANNQQLSDTVDLLRESMQRADALDREWEDVGQYRASESAGGEAGGYPMPDHGLFVAGLIHAAAPGARLSYQPVLDDRGVGYLSLLLMGLQRVLQDAATGPRIINLSLGLIPHPARLPAAWYGLPRPHDPMYARSEALFDAARDERWVATNREHVDRTMDLLQVGLRELGRYLRLNNCLVIAAAGNDSFSDVQLGLTRMEPRLPARFESVLGVAATTANPREAAPYSNLGDERVLGDHVASFGGNVTSKDQPQDGVIGIYSGSFPDGVENSTGWAYWSGTSFATAIVSGIAARLWSAAPELTADEVLAQLHTRAIDSGQYVSELHVPSIAVEGRWRE